MTKRKEYKNDNPVTVASEPVAAYGTTSSVQTRARQIRSMSVDEYFAKVRKALDKRYENL